MTTSDYVWNLKYRAPGETNISDTFRRVVKATVGTGTEDSELFDAMKSLELIPAGRILANAGSREGRTMVNTFAMPTFGGDFDDVEAALETSMNTMRAGGGIGINLDSVPACTRRDSSGRPLNGPIAVLRTWNSMCGALLSGSARRGAMMGVIRCDHPDLIDFIEAKSITDDLNHFNLSVLITDAFMTAVAADANWGLIDCRGTVRSLPAKEVWDRLVRASYNGAEPGVIFIDRINQRNNLGYCEDVVVTNSCAEQPLPPNGCSPLASINLAALVLHPFSDRAAVDTDRLRWLARLGVRFLDAVVDATTYPNEAQRREASLKRRIGLGFTGLGDALVMCRARYGSERSLELVSQWMRVFRQASYSASAELASEKGPFEAFSDAMLDRPMLVSLDTETRSAILKSGLRNGVINSVAPTGSISLLADNVSSGIEPVFAHALDRKVMQVDGTREIIRCESWSLRAYERLGHKKSALPDYFATALEISPQDHLAVLAEVQKYVDASISKTVNCASDIDFRDFSDVYNTAYRTGCNSVAMYRDSSLPEAILTALDS